MSSSHLPPIITSTNSAGRTLFVMKFLSRVAEERAFLHTDEAARELSSPGISTSTSQTARFLLQQAAKKTA